MSERVEVFELDLTEVQEEAQATGQTLKELRAEVKELRTTLENTEVGTEEFGKALTDLTIKQQELTNVTKSGIAAQKGSYNDLVNQMALLKAEWRSTADEGKRVALGEQINEINIRLKEMDASIGNYQRNVGNYRQELKQLKEDLLTLEEGTEEYSTALARAAEISQKMQDVNEFVAQSAQDLGDHMQNVVGVASGMVGAFQTVQASLNLIGVESENIEKMIATMQNLMAITQGLTAIEGAIDKYKRLNETIKGLTIVQNLFSASKKKSAAASTADAAASTADAAAKGAQTVATQSATTAQWSLNAAMAANPLGVILVAIMAVVAGITALTSWLKSATDASEELADMNEKLEESQAAMNRETNFQIRLMQAQGKSTKEILEYQKKRIQGNIEEAESNLALMKSKADRGWWDKINDEEREQIQAAEDNLKELRESLRSIEEDIVIDAVETKTKQNKELQKLDEERTKQAIADARQRKQKLLDVQKEYNEAVAELATEVFLSQLGDNDRAREEYQLEQWHLGELVKYRKYLKDKNITQEQYNQISIQLQDVYQVRLSEIEEKYRDSEQKKKEDAYKEELDALKEHLERIKKVRDRSLRGVIAGEDTINTQYDREIPMADDIGEKFDLQRSKLEALKKLYTENIAIIEAQDQKERERLQAAIISAEAQGQNADDLKDQLASIGTEAINLQEKLKGVNRELDLVGNEELKEKLLVIKDQFSELKNTFSELNDIGGAFSNEWTNVFDSVIAGIDTTVKSLDVLGDKSAGTKKKLGAIFDMAAAGFQAVSAVMGAIADEQDETTKEGFEKQKKYQIAQATMSMLAGIMAAWTSAMMLPPPMSWIMGGIMTAATATLGAIQIANIKKQKFDGSGGDPGLAPIPNMTAMTAMGTPVSATTNIEGASTEGQVKDTRVYVLESDISNSQNNVKTTVAEATF